MALRKGIAKGRALESNGYEIGRGNDTEYLVRSFVLLNAGNQSFIDEFLFKYKKRNGRRISMSRLVRVALKHFSELPEDEQFNLL
jgi:hypothetical protein